VTGRAVIALLTPTAWAPPGIAVPAWRAALAEDVVDVLATLSGVVLAIGAVAADRSLAESVAWPGMSVYELRAARPRLALSVAAEHGYDQAAVVAADAPDLPGLLIGKLLRPLTTRTVAIAPAADGAGLLGVSARLPVPDWLPDLDLDRAVPEELSAAAPTRGLVAVTPGWHRLRGPQALTRLDLGLEGWEATRALLARTGG
jgi:hypothetical protein